MFCNREESTWMRLAGGWQRKKAIYGWGATPDCTFLNIDPSRSAETYKRIFRLFRGTLTVRVHRGYIVRISPQFNCSVIGLFYWKSTCYVNFFEKNVAKFCAHFAFSICAI